MAYEPSSVDYTDPRMQYAAKPDQLDAHRVRSRASSTVRNDGNLPEQYRHGQLQRNPPIDDVVTTAVKTAETSTHVPPELIAQITASVINQLKSTGIDGGTPIPPPPPPMQQPVPLSPSTISASSPSMPSRNMHTPPSPHKPSDFWGRGSPPAQSSFAQAIPMSPSPHAQFHDRRTSSPLSQSSESGYTRPRGPTRLSTSREETTLEKIWGQLFDEDSNPTARLSDFLRGLAVHIIEDYEPQHSIVITPAKMIKYYEDVKLPDEIYPWSSVFDEERCKLSRLYRDLSCQHHLVQEQNDQRPEIPALTPVGFERWVTLLILAHPEEEYQRLQKAVLDMPINSPDKKERFPKEISRRLFPSSGDRKAQECLEKAILEHADVDLPKRNRDCSPFHRPSVGTESMHVPPARSNAPSEYVPPNYERDLNIGAESTAPPTFLGSSIERERAPYSNTPAEAIIDDTNPFPSAFQPLERERKPYSAVPGVGKARDDGLPGGEPRSNSITSRPGFSNSTAPSRPIPKNASGATGQRPMDMPKPEIHHHHSNARRNRSPSFSGAGNDFRRSDGDIRGFPQPFPPSSLPAVDPFEDHARRYPRDQADRARRQADDEARAYGQSPNARGKPDREMDINGPHRASYHTDEDYYRNAGRGGGSGYDYSQPYGGPVYR